jgi:hypothetical protein
MTIDYPHASPGLAVIDHCSTMTAKIVVLQRTLKLIEQDVPKKNTNVLPRVACWLGLTPFVDLSKVFAM